MEASDLLKNARSEQQKGNKSQAIKFYSTIVEKFPDSKEFQEAKAEIKYLKSTENNVNTTSASSDSITSKPKFTPYKSTYGTARFISLVVSFLGWLVVIAGIVGIFVGLETGSKMLRGDASILAILPGIGVILSGLFLVIAGQITRATVDNADHTGEMLQIMKNKNGA